MKPAANLVEAIKAESAAIHALLKAVRDEHRANGSLLAPRPEADCECCGSDHAFDALYEVWSDASDETSLAMDAYVEAYELVEELVHA